MKIISRLFVGAMACGLLVHVPAAHAGRAQVLYNFCSRQHCTDGFGPSSGLTDANGVLYGMTRYGGARKCNRSNPCGEVFALDPQTGEETEVHPFRGPDGVHPSGGVIDVRGTLYGTTDEGGAQGAGTIFSLDPQTGAEAVLHSFAGGSDGSAPQGGLIEVGGKLYGATALGGGVGCFAEGCGTVFVVNKKTGAEKVLHAFSGDADGAFPYAGLISANGKLYGTTTEGGGSECSSEGCGTVFAIDPKTGAETVVHSFAGGNDGVNPIGSLISVDGTLYGTTGGGGAQGAGTVFAFDPGTGAETVLYSFCSEQDCNDGEEPEAGLVSANGKLYGTTMLGGANNKGMVFALDLATNSEKVLYSFCSLENCADGQRQGPQMGALLVKGGRLYGTTNSGGAHGGGTVFSIKP